MKIWRRRPPAIPIRPETEPRTELIQGRSLYHVYRMHWEKGDAYSDPDRTEVSDPALATLIGSEMADRVKWYEWHKPVLDIDYSADLVPSKTPGHYHLYLNKPVEWRDYKRLIKALAKARLIEKGYAKAALRRRQTFVRMPTREKPTYSSSLDIYG